MGSEQRTPGRRALAERALMRFRNAIPHQASANFVLVGGLAVDYLVDASAPTHLGTTDMDLLLPVAVVYDRDEDDFGWVETALRTAGFTVTADPSVWTTTVDGFTVKMELLCDVRGDDTSPVPLPNCEHAAAVQFNGPRAALEAPIEVSLTDDGSNVIHVCGTGGFLLSKAWAAGARPKRAPKDLYDFAYVLIHNHRGGPIAAAEDVAAMKTETIDDYWVRLRWMISQFTSGDRPGAHDYAQNMQPTDTAYAVLIEDAAGAAETFASELCRRLGRVW